MVESLNLDSKLLNPMKEGLEQSIDILTKNALLTKKEAEIILKIDIGVTKRFDKEKEWIEPKFEYQLKERIKEAKSSYKNDLGFNYEIKLDDDNNILIENINEQTNLFEGGK